MKLFSQSPKTKKPVVTRPITDDDWKLLYYFNLYRLVLASVLITLSLSGQASRNLAFYSPWLFFLASVGIGLSCLLYFFTINAQRPRFSLQANFQIGLDIFLITLLLYASKTTGGGLTLLFAVSIAAAGVMLSARMTMFYAATASVMVLLHQVYAYYVKQSSLADFTQAGLLGIALFVTGLMLRLISLRTRETETLAAEHQQEALRLDELNNVIVEEIDHGIVAVDADKLVAVINQAARRMLGSKASSSGHPLSGTSPRLEILYRQWQENPSAHSPESILSIGENKLAVSFSPIADYTLIVLENITEQQRQLERSKLAALGRLAAGIAHEVRNPLSAIRQAAQLMAESPLANDEDQRLTDLIDNNTKRIDKIVTTVLSFSQQQKETVTLKLRDWLFEFREVFTQVESLPLDSIRIDGPNIEIQSDPEHLTQVVTNLCSNALRHNPPYRDQPIIHLISRAPVDGTAMTLDVIDYGYGVTPDLRDKIFEPFFSTYPGGVGLGLYISRQLCEANGGRLELIPSERETRFRITFPNNRSRLANAA